MGIGPGIGLGIGRSFAVGGGSDEPDFSPYGTIGFRARADECLNAGGTPCTNGQDIQTLLKKSGTGGGNMAALSSTQRPTYVASDAAYGGRPVMQFTGTDADGLETTVAIGGAQPFTIFLIGEISDLATNRTLFDDPGGGSVSALFGLAGGGTSYRINNGTPQTSAGGSGSTVPSIYCEVGNGASSLLYRGGGSPLISANGGANYFDGGIRLGLTSGGGAPLEGFIGEILIYLNALAASALNNVGGLFNAYYGLPWNTV